MPFYFFVWNDLLMDHLAQHEVTPEEFEQVVCDSLSEDMSRSSGRPVAYGVTEEGRHLLCVFEFLDEHTVLPITAYEVE